MGKLFKKWNEYSEDWSKYLSYEVEVWRLQGEGNKIGNHRWCRLIIRIKITNDRYMARKRFDQDEKTEVIVVKVLSILYLCKMNQTRDTFENGNSKWKKTGEKLIPCWT